MSGAVTELVAQGVQDTFLTGEPQMSYFKQLYRRYTNFSMEYVRQIFKGQPAAGSMSSCTMRKSGDLIGGMYLSSKDGTGTGQSDPPIAALVDKFELYIGGQLIDSYSGDSSALFASTGLIPKNNLAPLITSRNFLPLYFFNCHNNASCIPLVALQYHEVDVRIHWKVGVTIPSDIAFYANNIYLDTQERELMVNTPMNIVISQNQEVKVQTGQKIIDLPFSHPVKVIMARQGPALVNGDVMTVEAPLYTGEVTLELNGQERFEPQSIIFFASVQPYYHGTSHGAYLVSLEEPSFVYSFALDYGQYNPCGTCNFSRLDNVRIHATSGTFGDPAATDPIVINAINYNVLKVENGMGGVMFAN